VISVPSLRGLLSILVAWSMLFAPRSAQAQEPSTPSDRDLDGIADSSDGCPDTYGAPPSGCPPQAPPPAVETPPPDPTPPPGPRTDRDADGLFDDEDACPDAPSASMSGCPEGQGPVVATPPATTPATTPEPVVDPNDEYQQVLDTLPKDFDINYRYDAPARKRQRDRDPGLAAKQARALGISGGVLMLAGTVGLISTLSVGLARANDAKDTLEDMESAQISDPSAPIDGAAREEALKKGEQGDKIAIIGGASTGAAFALGAALLIGARSIRNKAYGGSGGGGGGGLSDKSRRNLTLYGALLLVYGTASLIGGAVLVQKDEAKKQKNGKILLGLGGTMAGIGVLMFIPVIVSRLKKTAQVNTGPMWVRGGGGAGVRVRF
jgi:hypothetical protein